MPLNNIHDFFALIMSILNHNNFEIQNKKMINYGVQFNCIKCDDDYGLLRLYYGKKGPKIDFSQLKPNCVSDLMALLDIDIFQTNKFVKNCSSLLKNERPSLPTEFPIIGVDESGKGDFFGPLVVAGVCVKTADLVKLNTLPISDSKTLSDSLILDLANDIRSHCSVYECILMPTDYNRHYQVFNNLNKLLAFFHLDVIEMLSKKTGCRLSLSDQFANKTVLESELATRKLDIDLRQQTKAESHIAVAAASIIARSSFLNAMDDLSQQYQFEFPKGATHVKHAAHLFCDHFGTNQLNNVAKTHFKILI